MMDNRREHWTSHLGFILAAAGSAVGLGNIWKFPYVTGMNGGGAFVLIYLLCVLVIGIPVMICEIVLGRHTQRNPVGAFAQLSPASSKAAHFFGISALLAGAALLMFRQWGYGVLFVALGGFIFRYGWRIAGVFGVLSGFLILAYYSVVGGWTIVYFCQAAAGALKFTAVTDAARHFEHFIQTPWMVIAGHAVFMAFCILIVYGGVRAGIERWSKVLMPGLFLLLCLIVLRSLSLPGALQGVRFYLAPDFSKITAGNILTALGLAFFSLSLGMGAMITYGSYLDRRENIFTSAVSVAALDTMVSLLAGLAIFPAVFAQGFAPDAGSGLVFQVLPTVFNTIPGGQFWAAIFFMLLAIAALTSGISLLEVVVAYFTDERHWPRSRATLMLGGLIFLAGILCAVSINDWTRLTRVEQILLKIFGAADKSCFDFLDHLASNWLLPLGGLCISIFTGWVWGTRHAVDEIRHGSHNFADVHLLCLAAGLRDDPSHNARTHALTLASLWGIFIRFISPIAVTLIFLRSIGVLSL